MTRVAVVTGANKGIGREIARQLLRAGFITVLAARDEARGREAASALGCGFVHIDLDSDASIGAAAEAVRREHGSIDALVNNAAIAFKGADPTPFAQQARPTLSTNFLGTLAVCDAFFPLLKDGGRVVNVASMAGHLRILRSDALAREFASADSTLTVGRLRDLTAAFVEDVEMGRHAAAGWPNSCYGTSKLAVVALTKIHARELAPRRISVSCC